jgi:hypothetical protein
MTKKERYELTKEMLFQKFDGKCALCGWDLDNIWHIWHIEPNKTIVTRKEVIIANDSYENKLPACASCNSTRNSHSQGQKKLGIEDFRRLLYFEFHFLREGMTYKTIYNKMIRFGLIEETGKSIEFYFEKINQ